MSLLTDVTPFMVCNYLPRFSLSFYMLQSHFKRLHRVCMLFVKTPRRQVLQWGFRMITLYYWQVSQPLVSFSILFHREWKLNLYLPIMYIYCNHPEISKSPLQLPKTETNVVLIVINSVLYHVRSYTVTVSFRRSTRIGYQKCFIRSMNK